MTEVALKRTRAGRCARLVIVALAFTLAACTAAAGSENLSPTATPLDPTDFVATLIAHAITGTAEARFGTATPLATPAATPRPPTPTPPAATSTLPPPTPVPPAATLPPPVVQISTATPIPATPAAETIPATQTIPTPCPPGDACPAGEHLWLTRPIGPEHINYVDPTYRYGDTQNGAREAHHGVEFQNPAGTPVLAVAPATVVVAGKDWTEVYGPSLYFYGTLVVLELDQQLHGQPVYVLYGHLLETNVQAGQKVASGDTIGQTGASGVALGPHLHFEVRVGQNDYLSTRNPELWLQPLPYNGRPWGILAGRVTDKEGNPLPGISVAIRSVEIDFTSPVNRYAVTYTGEAINSDDVLQESFVMGDLPTGTYEISVNTTTLYRQTVTIKPGKVTLVDFEVNPPPVTPTLTP